MEKSKLKIIWGKGDRRKIGIGGVNSIVDLENTPFFSLKYVFIYN